MCGSLLWGQSVFNMRPGFSIELPGLRSRKAGAGTRPGSRHEHCRESRLQCPGLLRAFCPSQSCQVYKCPQIWGEEYKRNMQSWHSGDVMRTLSRYQLQH